MKILPTTFIRSLIWIIKIAIVIAAGYFIYEKIFHSNNGDLHHLRDSFNGQPGLFTAAFLLLFLNWGLEAWKWKLLLQDTMRITFFRALRSVLAGVTTGIFTPNRVGELGGRVFDLEEGHWLEAALLSMAGGLIQLSVTVLVAIPAAFIYHPGSKLHWPFMQLSLILSCLIPVSLCMLWLFRERLEARTGKYLTLLKRQTAAYWMKIFFISLLRYAVFTFQFFLLLRAFHIDKSAAELIPEIALVFFTTSLIPTFALTEIGVRVFAAGFFIGTNNVDTDLVWTASLLLWIINIAFPALAGAVFVLMINLWKRKKEI
jgi:hypothetical protein